MEWKMPRALRRIDVALPTAVVERTATELRLRPRWQAECGPRLGSL